jgi:hypothetical protein
MGSVVCMNKFISRNKSPAEAITAIITVRSWKVVSSSVATFLPYVVEKWAFVTVTDLNTVFLIYKSTNLK